ncbi:Uncharacterised protein [Vibrio cholerae]|nr:Uncharacterised protein [Vibrio cholerae]
MRWLLKISASVSSCLAGTPQMPSAHCADFSTPSSLPSKYASKRS